MSTGRGGAPSRDQQAFRWLLEGNGDDEAAPSSANRRPGKGKGGASSGGGGRRRSGGKQPFIPGFKLRCDAEAEASAASAAPASELESLQEAFAGVLDGDLVADVLASCGGDAAAAMEALLALAGGGDGGSSGAEQPGEAEDTAEGASGEARDTAAGGSGGPNCWDVLPMELKCLVFEQLSLRDLARAARTCREFATYVREQRRSMRTVVVPEGISYAAVRGLVAAFAGAGGVTLSRCAAQLRFQNEFEDMLGAVARGEADRRGGVPVSHINLAKCGRVTDAALGTVCDTFAHLRSLDLSRCVEVSDAGMTRLAAYTREAPAGDSNSSSAGEEEEEEEGGWGEEAEAAGPDAAGAALEDLQLSAAGGRAAQARKGAVPAMESPDSAVRRIAAQRHAAMLERSARTARTLHGRPRDLGLQELSLKESSVSARGTKLLLQPGSATSKSLKVLDVSRCPNIGGDALDLHPRCVVETLRAPGCNALRSVVIQLPPEAPLRVLNLESCRQLLEVVLVAHRLESANFSHCGQLRHISLRCRRLRELRAVNCGSLSLAASDLQCPALLEANFFGCRQLDAEGIEAAAPSLTKCASLDLTGCTSLSRLLLPDCTALQTVSVMGCALLRQILLASPALRRLRAAGCSRLVELRLGTAAVQELDLENCDHLREVQLSEASGSLRSSLDGAAGRQEAGGKKSKPALVLKGCTSLPEDAKKRLRETVLGC